MPSGKPAEDTFHGTQDLLGIKQFVGGMVCMDNGSIIGIQEIIPVNYYQKTVFERNNISITFQNLFKVAPAKMHFKMRTEKADVNKVIQNILEANKEETNRNLLTELSDYIDYVRELQTNDSLCKRFYLIFEYEGEDGKRSNNINQIYRSMESTKQIIRNIFYEMGHICITPPDVNYYLGEMLYKFFNPLTSLSEPFSSRVKRVQEDAKKYNRSVSEKEKKTPREEDYVAPKGIKLKPSYIVMDGVYHTYLTLRDIGHPSLVTTGWTDLLCMGLGYDVDYLIKKLPYDPTLAAIQQFNKFSRVHANSKVNSPDKYNELAAGIRNKNFIVDHMKNADEDLWNVLIIITIRANSYQNMLLRKNNMVKMLKSKSIYVEDSFQTAYRNFKMTMPFMYIDNKLFNKNKRNYLSSTLASLYNYTAYELYDDTGIVLGSNVRNNSISAINPFNTNYYSNANILLTGAPGSGKTYTELMMARRMRMSGMRTFFILPAKGEEYYDGVNAVGGSYIPLHPGAKACLNIMQIHPEIKIDESLIDENSGTIKVSLLSKKITSIITWISLLMKNETLAVKEINRLNKLITEIYERFDITHDNDSIYRNKELGILKEMPILQDLNDALEKDEFLYRLTDVIAPFIEGSFQNFNGQSNVDLTNKCIAFDVDEEIIGKEVLPSIMYIAFDCIYDIVKQDKNSMDMCFIDEAWKILQNDFCAEQIEKMIRLIRGYGGGVIIASQNIEEFSRTRNGIAILSCTETKIFMKMKENEINAISETVNLSTEDKFSLRKLKRGYGLIYSNGDKVLLKFKSTNREEELFTTDINVKRKIAARRKKKKAIPVK